MCVKEHEVLLWDSRRMASAGRDTGLEEHRPWQNTLSAFHRCHVLISQLQESMSKSYRKGEGRPLSSPFRTVGFYNQYLLYGTKWNRQSVQRASELALCLNT